MAWIQVQEQGQLASSERTVEERTASKVFVARSDEPTTPTAAETASDGSVTIPAIGDPDDEDPGRKVVKVAAQPDEESPRNVFRITVEFSSKAEGTEKPENPLDRDDEIVWDFSDAREPYFLDRSDTPKPVMTSAGEPFEDFLERDSGSIIATITRNIAANAYSPATALQYKNAVNSDAFTLDGVNIEVGQCKLKAYTAGAKQTENDVQYRVAKWVLEFRESWDDVIDDRGFNEKDPDNAGKLRPILKGTPPVPVDKPWPLDGAGAKKPNSTDEPNELTFRPYARQAFASFSFT